MLHLMFEVRTDIGDGNDLWRWIDRGWSMVRDADAFTGEGLGCAGNGSRFQDTWTKT